MPQARLENGVALEYQVHGNLTSPVILVILGITDNITDWPVGLYQPLIENGYCVVRYELRDSGFSTKFDHFGVPDLKSIKQRLAAGEKVEAPYDAHDMSDDASLLLDFLGIQSATIVGYSYGAMVAQLLGLKHPDKVEALVCLQGSNYNPNLSERTPEVDQAMVAATMEYGSIEEKVGAIQGLRIATNGSRYAMDAREALTSAETSVNRMYYPHGTARIVLSRLITPPFFQQTNEIGCPVLVLHGDDDPIFPIDHGKDIADRIPNARLRVLSGAGHNHPVSLQPLIAESILDFVRSVNPVQ